MYGAAMLLGLLGRPLSRQDAHRCFGTRRIGWVPPDIDSVAEVIGRFVGRERVVVWSGRFDSAPELGEALRARLGSVGALFVAASCRLLPERVHARHAVVVTGVAREKMAFLDPLGRNPVAGSCSNDSIALQAQGRYLPTSASHWQLDLRFVVDLLEVKRDD